MALQSNGMAWLMLAMMMAEGGGVGSRAEVKGEERGDGKLRGEAGRTMVTITMMMATIMMMVMMMVRIAMSFRCFPTQ